MSEIPAELWVKFKDYYAAQVSTDGCKNVYQLIKAVKKEMTPLLDAYAAAQLSLFLWGKEEDLDPGQILNAIDFIGNNSNTPLVIKVKESQRSDQGYQSTPNSDSMPESIVENPREIVTEIFKINISADVTFKRLSLELENDPTGDTTYIVPMMEFVCREEPAKCLYDLLDNYLDWKGDQKGEFEKNIKFATVVGTSGKGKTTFARRFLDLPYTGKYVSVVQDCQRSNRRYRISCTNFNIDGDPETQLSMMILFEAFKYFSKIVLDYSTFSTLYYSKFKKLRFTDVMKLITESIASDQGISAEKRLVVINVDETNDLLDAPKRKLFLKQILRILRSTAWSFTLLMILSGTHSVDLFNQIQISQCKFVDIDLKLITVEGAKKVILGMTDLKVKISPYLVYLLMLCGGVGRYLEIAIIQMSIIGAFERDGLSISGFKKEYFDFFLTEMQSLDSIQRLLPRISKQIVVHYPTVFTKYCAVIELVSCYTYFQWPVHRHSIIGKLSVGDLEKEGLVFLEPIADQPEQYTCSIPFLSLYWALQNSSIKVQIPFIMDLTGYFSPDESENNTLRIFMAKLWGLYHKNNLVIDTDGLCEIFLSDLVWLRRDQEDVRIKFRPVFQIFSSRERIIVENVDEFKNVRECIAFLNAKGASFTDAVIFSNPVIGIQEKQSVIAKEKILTGKEPNLSPNDLFQRERTKFLKDGLFFYVTDGKLGAVKLGQYDIVIDNESFPTFAGPLIALRKLYSLNQLNPSFKKIKTH